ncbi:NAD(P)-binding protein [Aulographum hederae CBS 113979]|uniref:NAD(P)-binding protein n=1 Tax=Aulographum hederae CBS 113979 TaxID=1176131 RepID=A0A6G1GIN8_9PEZI|nr:NAD(P)-binding protein [Aulographum hederae CBS 113979]
MFSATSNFSNQRQADLAGKVAVITGASRGIGRATALNLASRGCSILGTCSKPDSIPLFDALRDEAKAVTPPGSAEVKVVGIAADIFTPDCHQTITNALEQHFSSRVDIFVNNAADPRPGTLGELTPEEIQQSMVANIQTPVLIVDEFVKRKMFQPDSRIIYISSIRSRQPWSGQLMYSVGKSAGESLCRTWAQAFGGREEKFAFMAGTTANAVTVGLTRTESVMSCPPEMIESFKDEFMPLQSIPRFGQPEDVADVIGLLCGRDGRWISGTVVSASGGGVKIG